MKYLFKKRRHRLLAALLDGVGAFFFIFHRRPEKVLQDARHILVVRLDHLGDVLFATALPQVLKENFSGCRLSFLTSSAGAALLENNPFVDEVLVYDAPWFLRAGGACSPKNSYGSVIHRLKQMEIDLALSLRGDLRENFLVFMARAKESVGYGITGGGFFLTRKLKYRRGVHEREHTQDILKYLGISRRPLQGRIYFSEKEEMAFLEKMDARGISENKDPIGVHLEAGTEAKEWPLESTEKFLSLCAEKFLMRSLVFVGTDTAHRKILDRFLISNPSLGWKNLIGQTSLRELLYVIRQCKLFVGLDSGPTHVAACFGIPTLFLYSGTNDWEEWRSLEENAEFLRHPVPCSPCHETRCPVQGHPCMSGIEPERALRWLEERSRGV